MLISSLVPSQYDKMILRWSAAQIGLSLATVPFILVLIQAPASCQ